MYTGAGGRRAGRWQLGALPAAKAIAMPRCCQCWLHRKQSKPLNHPCTPACLPACRYTSKVTLHSPTAVHSRVDDSTLFSHLTNKWEFRWVGGAGWAGE